MEPDFKLTDEHRALCWMLAAAAALTTYKHGDAKIIETTAHIADKMLDEFELRFDKGA